MAEMLSPGVYVTEIDQSTIVPTVSNSIGVFAGKFNKGPIDAYMFISNVDELNEFFGTPTNSNYNDYYQAYSFLQYADKLYVSRAIDTTLEPQSDGEEVGKIGEAGAAAGSTVIPTNGDLTSKIAKGDLISFGNFVDENNVDENSTVYEVADITSSNITLTSGIESDLSGNIGSEDNIFVVTSAFNAVGLAVQVGGTLATPGFELIKNADDFEDNHTFKAEHLKFIAQNPGTWGEDIQVSIANPSDFGQGNYVIPDVKLDDLFEYFPDANDSEIAIVISENGQVKESYIVSLDESVKDYLGKSKYIENIINEQSTIVYVTDSTDGTVNSYISGQFNGETNSYSSNPISLINGKDGDISKPALLNAYELWDNKEDLDIDVVISNEFDGGASALALCETRKDCIGFVGAKYSDVVGKKSSIAVQNLIASRKSQETTEFSVNSMFMVANANYVYIYDRYNDKNRWVNIAGHIAGLRAQTNTTNASWWASAGLERGQLKGVKKLAFNPNAAQRDLLYKNGLNPICSFPGQGIVMWGQKTLLDKPSSFDRVNIRGLFNTMERALTKMAKIFGPCKSNFTMKTSLIAGTSC